MILAELEVFQSRPVAPTRRVALGRRDLPAEPSPGFGGLLLAGVVAGFTGDIDDDLQPDLLALSYQVEQGMRIPQPRLRHRFQVDHIGLNRRIHRLTGDGEQLDLHLDDAAGTSPAPQVLAAIYAVGRLERGPRSAVMALCRRAMHWTGERTDDGLLTWLTGSDHVASLLSVADPFAWARGVLGIDGDGDGRKEVQAAFRAGLRAAHPDHGGEHDGAAGRIAELTEARRILLTG